MQFFTNESSPAQSSAKANMGTPVVLLLKRTTILNEGHTFIFKCDEDFSWLRRCVDIVPGNEVVGDELGLNRGAPPWS